METETKDWLTVPEVAEILRFPRTRAYALVQAGEIPATRIGERSIRVNRKELEEYLLRERRIAKHEEVDMT